MAYPEIGSTIGNYRLHKLLGEGGAALVYLGEHIYLQNQAALKILRGYSAQGRNALQKFQSEARTIANLKHSHIVRLLDFGVEKDLDLPYLVMDYASHGTVYTLYPRGTLLPLEQVVIYTRQAAEALHYAHGQNIIHCDVKPANMLLDANDEILLSDFGISTVMRDSMHSQEIAGTFAYMAPEQFRGRPLPASDQYALGIVVYEWLCGQLPFRGSMFEVLQQQLYTSPVSLRQIRPEVPLQVEQVVLRALAKDPAERFENIEYFAQALAAAGDGIYPNVIDALPMFSTPSDAWNATAQGFPSVQGMFPDPTQPQMGDDSFPLLHGLGPGKIEQEKQDAPFVLRTGQYVEPEEETEPDGRILLAGRSLEPENFAVLPIVPASPSVWLTVPEQVGEEEVPPALRAISGMLKQEAEEPEPAGPVVPLSFEDKEGGEENVPPPALRAISGMLKQELEEIGYVPPAAPLSLFAEPGREEEPPILRAISGALDKYERQETPAAHVDNYMTIPASSSADNIPEPYISKDQIADLVTVKAGENEQAEVGEGELFVLVSPAGLLHSEVVEEEEEVSREVPVLSAEQARENLVVLPPSVIGSLHLQPLQEPQTPLPEEAVAENEAEEQQQKQKKSQEKPSRVKEKAPESVGETKPESKGEESIQQENMVRVFISYSHQDTRYREKLQTYLVSLERLYPATSWFDGKILAGDEYEKVIKEQLAEAHLILLLVSQDFIASKYCQERELKPAMERHERGEAIVIPIIVRDCLWEEHRTPFGKLQALPPNGRSINAFSKKEEAFKKVVLGIERAIVNLLEKKHKRT